MKTSAFLSHVCRYEFHDSSMKMVPEPAGLATMMASPEASPSTSRDECWYMEKAGRLFGYDEIIAPWATKRYSLSIEGLHEEIKDIFQWLRPCRLEEAVRLEVFRKVKNAIKERWKGNNVKVSVFGSLRTRLFLPTSDIDVLVECEEWKDTCAMANCMQETANYLEEVGLAKSVAVFSDAFVPIVKMVEKDTLVNVDISFNTAQGVKAADYIEKVKEEFPVVEPLILVLKQFLILRRLNTTYTGGLSSYGLILMLINFLHHYGMPVRRKHPYSPEVNLGELLMRFFEVYAQEVNYDAVGISVIDMRYTPKEARRDGDKKAALLSIEDPLLITNEVGRSSFNYALVRSAFEQALQILKGVFIRDRRCGAEWRRFYKGSMMSLIMPFTQEQLQYRNWLKSFVLEYKEPEQPPSTIVCNTFLAPSVDLAKCALQQYIMSLPRSSRPLEIVDPRDLERMSTTTSETSQSHDNVSETTCTSSSASDDAGPVVEAPIDGLSALTLSEKSETESSEVEVRCNGINGNVKRDESREKSEPSEKPATTLAAIVAGKVNRLKSRESADELDKKNGNMKGRTPSPSENKTPPVTATTPRHNGNNPTGPSAALPPAQCRVFHNQQYYQKHEQRTGSASSRDGGRGAGNASRPLGAGGNGAPRSGRKPAQQYQQAPPPSSNGHSTQSRTSRSGGPLRKSYSGVYYKRGSGPAGGRRDTTPRLASDDGGESSERDSVKNDGYQTLCSTRIR
ncbi:unnamed protein product [Cylicocyclus nassatus]|uniref:Polynucleotide adenylyltransferase n=2 Tax=Strongylidae TaxID=27830 RepID=A0AA36GPG9_CYLNA|nr:unnamed protein product [Cylicocyclus nassatus]